MRRTQLRLLSNRDGATGSGVLTRYPWFGLKLAAERSGLGPQLLVASNEIHKILGGAIFFLLSKPRTRPYAEMDHSLAM